MVARRGFGLILLALLPGLAAAALPSGGRASEGQSAVPCRAELGAVVQRLQALPNDENLLMRQGNALYCLDRRAEALAVFQRVLSLNPRLPAAHNNVAVILAGEGKDAEARAALDQALRTNEATATAYDNLSRLYAYQASQAYRKAFNSEKASKLGRPALALSMTPGIEERAVVRGDSRTDGRTDGRTNSAAAPVPSPLAGLSIPPVRPREPAKPEAPALAALVAPPGSAASAAAPIAVAPAPASTAAAPAPEREEVLAALEAWALAWSRQDMNAYEAAYLPDFKGSMSSHAEWRKERAARIKGRNRIQVVVSEVSVTLTADQAQVKFLQLYQSDGRSIRSRKSIEMRRLKDRWVIAEESGR